MKTNIKNIILFALYVALMVVLGVFGTINFSGLKITLQNLPLIVAAITLGVPGGTLVGFSGAFIIQMLTYGLAPLTLLWVLPHTIIGLFLGLIFEKEYVKHDSGIKFTIAIIISQVLLTILNTIVMYVDSIVYGYYTFITIFVAFIIRLMIAIILSFIYSLILPSIINVIKKIH